MNRQERRKNKVKGHEPVINIKTEDVKRMKDDATEKATREAFELMLAVPVYVLHNEFGSFIKKEVNGKSRVERFMDRCLEVFEDFGRGLISINDLRGVLNDEAGMSLKDVKV